jgi:hypothetical protein
MITQDERHFYPVGVLMGGIYRTGPRRLWTSYAMDRNGYLLRGMGYLIVDDFGNLVRIYIT